jgi:hypothetical protein
MVFNATFKNISVISWRSVLLMKEIGVPGEAEITTLVVIDTDCIGSYKLPYNPDHDGP